MNLINLQNVFIESCKISDNSDSKDLTKKFELQCEKKSFDDLYRAVIASYISNEKPKQGFRKQKKKAEDLSDLEICAYESQKYNDSMTFKERIEHDIISLVINNKILDNFDGKRIGNPIKKFSKESDGWIFYDVSLDIFEGPDQINFDDIEIDNIIYDESQISENDIEDSKKNILNQKYKAEITDSEFKISEDLKSRDMIFLVDFEGRLVFGKKRIKFKGSSAKDFEMQFGKGKMLPDFENNLLGMKNGETKIFSMKFPDNYSKGLSGETAEFTVSLKKVFEMRPYENLEEYLEKNNKTEEVLKADIIKSLQNEIKSKKDIIEKDQLFQKLNEKFADLPLPSDLIQKEFQISKENYENRKKEKEKSEAEHVHNESCNHENDKKFIEVSDEELMDIVKTKIKLMILISTIAEKHNIVPNQMDLMNEIFSQASKINMDPFEALKYFQSNKQASEYLQKSALEKKVVDFCLSKSKRNEKRLSKTEINELYEKILEED
jgi:trigger factor